MSEILHDIYFNPEQPGAFTGPNKLSKAAQNLGYDVSRFKAEKWLQNQDAYSLHKTLRYKFKRNRVIPRGTDSLWDIDLADVSNIEKHNSGIQFWLIAIDVFSRYAWVRTLQDKTHQSVIQALETIFNEGRKPISIRSDKGREFANRWVTKVMKGQDIYFYNTQNETKASYAERFIRTLKAMMYRYFTHKQTYKYDDIIQDLVSNYNHTPHTSLLGRTPSSITKHEPALWKKIYVDSLKRKVATRRVRRSVLKPKPYKFKIGDYVRLSYIKHPFQRGYQEQWTEEIFIVRERFRRGNIPLFKIKDWNQEFVQGTFYSSELQRVDKDNTNLWKIEEILKTRKRNGLKEFYVSLAKKI